MLSIIKFQQIYPELLKNGQKWNLNGQNGSSQPISQSIKQFEPNQS